MLLLLLTLVLFTSTTSAEQFVCTTYTPTATTVIYKRVEGNLFVRPLHPVYQSEFESLAKLAYLEATHETEEAIWFLEPRESHGPKGRGFGAGYSATVISKTTGTYFMDVQDIEDPDKSHDIGACEVMD